MTADTVKTPVPTRLKRYAKAGVAAAGAILVFASTFAPDNKYVVAAVAVATAFGVWRVPNAPKPTTITHLLPQAPTPRIGPILPPSRDPKAS